MKPNRSMPSAAVIPVLIYPDVREAVDWLASAFGFEERVWIGENHRAQLRFGGGALIVGDVRGDRRPPRSGEVTHSVVVRVEDAAAHCAHARERGAVILMEPIDHPYGERQYNAEDPWGHQWTFSQTLADVAPEQWGGVTVGGGGHGTGAASMPLRSPGDRHAAIADAACATHRGDDVVADANVVFDRTRVIAGTPPQIWPWLVQLGKQRAGWYLPSRFERAVPRSRRAARVLDPRWAELEVGRRIPDYGGRRAFLEVAVLEPDRALVYRSQRRDAVFSWALLLDAVSPTSTRVHLRFRGRLSSSGWRRRVIVAVGELFDRWSAELMLSGLAERVEAPASSPNRAPSQ